MEEEVLYSGKITKGKHTYFFDINKNEQGDLYLKISEDQKTDTGFEQSRLMFFEENINDFIKVLSNTIATFQEFEEPKKTKDKVYSFEAPTKLENKAYSFKEIRHKYPQAYMSWTAEDDDNFEKLFCQGIKPKELAKIFGRNQGAITSRIRKLKLKDKYND